MLTEEEHEARAMLLERLYAPLISTYIKTNYALHDAVRYLDAETMEPLSHGTVLLRIKNLDAIAIGQII